MNRRRKRAESKAFPVASAKLAEALCGSHLCSPIVLVNSATSAVLQIPQLTQSPVACLRVMAFSGSTAIFFFPQLLSVCLQPAASARVFFSNLLAVGLFSSVF